jgi:hypothetical protein
MSAQKNNNKIGGGQGISTRLERWLGEDELAALRPINLSQMMIENLPTEEIASITVNNLCIYGKRELEAFLKHLPPDHRLEPPHKLAPKVLTKLPWFGMCRIGNIPLSEKRGRLLVNQIYIANFESDIDFSPAAKEAFKFTAQQRKVVAPGAKMIFGVNVILDARTEKMLGFHYESGDKSITFKTSSKQDALREIVEVSRLMTAGQLCSKFGIKPPEGSHKQAERDRVVLPGAHNTPDERDKFAVIRPGA